MMKNLGKEILAIAIVAASFPVWIVPLIAFVAMSFLYGKYQVEGY